MKVKSFEIEAFTIAETTRKLGYKSSGVIYRLLIKNILKDYLYLTRSGRVYLILEPPNLPTLAEKIAANIHIEKKILSSGTSSKRFIQKFKLRFLFFDLVKIHFLEKFPLNSLGKNSNCLLISPL